MEGTRFSESTVSSHSSHSDARQPTFLVVGDIIAVGAVRGVSK